MLEIKELTKIYKPKKGVPVVALDHINLKLPDRGMVFVLGKSGSGKSTLLNVLGGLDSFDEGEVYIKGELAKDFKQMHYDSYRNTYIGFIFQEYNILKDFTVGANIALAIELQGRVPENDEINRILKEVDLEGFGERKPNELSGGQLQRVAIARALVKNPDIIMADEPTGALDSKTGAAIFDTLKKLSETKLVLIVSHDREFSEHYADRIIELSDGKIISDVSLLQEDKKINEEQSENQDDEIALTFDEDKISVSKGYQLTEEDLKLINQFLAKNKDHDVDINILMAKNATFKNNKREFKDTILEDIQMDNSGFKLIKSKLSLKNSFKIGASGLKYKKFKLIMTILLSFVAFTMFGLVDTIAAYKYEKTVTNSLIDSKVDYATFAKYINTYEKYDGVYYYQSGGNFSEQEIEQFNEYYGIHAKGVYTIRSKKGWGNERLSFENHIDYKDNDSLKNNLYPTYFAGFLEMTNEDLNIYQYELLGKGARMPDGTKNEIAISKFIFESFNTNKFLEYDSLTRDTVSKEYDIRSVDDIIGKKVIIFDDIYTITAVIDTKLDLSKFDRLLEEEKEDDLDLIRYALQMELQSIYNYSISSVAFVGKGFTKILNSKYEYNIISMKNGTLSVPGYSDYYDLSFNYLAKLKSQDYEIEWTDGQKTELKDNEVVISLSMLRSLISEIDYSDKASMINLNDYDKEYIIEGTKLKISDFYDFASDYHGLRYKLNAIAFVDYYINKINENYAFYENLYITETSETNPTVKEVVSYIIDSNNYKSYDLPEEVNSTLIQLLLSIYKKVNGSYKLEYGYRPNNYSYEEKLDYKEFDIVGIAKFTYNMDYLITSDAFFNLYTEYDPNEIYSLAMGPMPTDRNTVYKLVKASRDDTAESRFQMKNNIIEEMEYIDELLVGIKKAFLYIGIGFALFASLLLSNFIATSITYKKQEIGILRAIGSRSNDVFRIFFSEAFIIAMINYVISLISTIIVVSIINKVIREDTFLSISILGFGIRQIIVLFALCVIISFAASFIPVKKIASKKPIDAIRNR